MKQWPNQQCPQVAGESWLKQPLATLTTEEVLCSVRQLFLPNAEWGLNREAQQSAGVPGEDVADLSPLIRLQQAAVRRVLNAVAQVHQAAHQDLNICRGDDDTHRCRTTPRDRKFYTSYPTTSSSTFFCNEKLSVVHSILFRQSRKIRTSLVLRGKGLKMSGILQGLHLVRDSPAEQADKVQTMQLELQAAVEVQKALPIRHSPPRTVQAVLSVRNKIKCVHSLQEREKTYSSAGLRSCILSASRILFSSRKGCFMLMSITTPDS